MPIVAYCALSAVLKRYAAASAFFLGMHVSVCFQCRVSAQSLSETSKRSREVTLGGGVPVGTVRSEETDIHF